MGIPLLSKKFYLNLLNKCSAQRLMIFLLCITVGGFILYHAYIKIHEETYFWQVNTLANFIRPIKRTQCIFNNNTTGQHNGKVGLKIGIASVYADNDNTWNDELMERVLKNRINYCQLHNYEFINANVLIDHSRPVAWSKLLLSKILPQYDYLVYMDMDVVIMDGHRSIEEFIDASPKDIDFIMTYDWSGPNTGVWIVKHTAFSIWFLQKAFDQKQLLSSRATNGYKYPFEYEQRAFHYLLNTKMWKARHLPLYNQDKAEEINQHFYYLPQCAFNSYIVHPFELRADREISQYIVGDFLVHFAGKKGKIKSDLINTYLGLADVTIDESNIEPSS